MEYYETQHWVFSALKSQVIRCLVCLFLQPGKPIDNNEENAPKLFIEHDSEDPEVISGKVMCDGKIISSGQSVTECLDFFFEFILDFQS